MVKLWARLLVGLVFVFVTISSPLHAHVPASSPGHAMTGMSHDCAHAMAGKSAESLTSKSLTTKSHIGSDGGCCAKDCQCPLSHCPGTLAVWDAVKLAPPHLYLASLSTHGQSILTSHPGETLKRPPRA